MGENWVRRLSRLDSNHFKLKKEYFIGKQIGQGAYATVRIGYNYKDKRKVAVKIYDKQWIREPARRKSVKREIKLL